MTYPTTGYTPELSNWQKADNIARRLRKCVTEDTATAIIYEVAGDGDFDDEFIRNLDYITRLLEDARSKVLEGFKKTRINFDPRTEAEREQVNHD